jgi:nucleoside-diphosphate-sugar epimerase
VLASRRRGATDAPQDTPGPVLLLTGATGFLGGHLARRLLAAGYQLVLLKRSGSNLARIRDIAGSLKTYDADTTSLEAVFDGGGISAVIHCATNYGRAGASAANVVETNLILPLRLLQIASKRGTRAFINTDTILDPRISYYSLSKSQFVDWMSHLGSHLATVNVALEHFYGPGDDASKFVTSIVRDLVRGVPSIALTPGGQKRDFIYVGDVVEALCAITAYALEAPDGFYRFEVGSSRLLTIREFVERARDLAGAGDTRLDFGALPYRPNEVMESRVDCSAIRALGWMPRTSLDEGLMTTIEAERKSLASS